MKGIPIWKALSGIMGMIAASIYFSGRFGVNGLARIGVACGIFIAILIILLLPSFLREEIRTWVSNWWRRHDYSARFMKRKFGLPYFVWAILGFIAGEFVLAFVIAAIATLLSGWPLLGVVLLGVVVGQFVIAVIIMKLLPKYPAPTNDTTY